MELGMIGLSRANLWKAPLTICSTRCCAVNSPELRQGDGGNSHQVEVAGI